jgi:hypothetical protein
VRLYKCYCVIWAAESCVERTVGWLKKENDSAIILTSHITDGSNHPEAVTIPRASIVSMKEMGRGWA